jgi:hypothetical protein
VLPSPRSEGRRVGDEGSSWEERLGMRGFAERGVEAKVDRCVNWVKCLGEEQR